jgi:hypothetical protein
VESALKGRNGKRLDDKGQKLHKTDGDRVSKRRPQRSRNPPPAISSRYRLPQKTPTSQQSRIRCRDLTETDEDNTSSSENKTDNTSSTTPEYVYEKILNFRKRNGMLEILIFWPKQNSWERASGFRRNKISKTKKNWKRKKTAIYKL